MILIVTINTARLAQSVEHKSLNVRVVGLSPTLGDFFFPSLLNCRLEDHIVLET